MGADTPGPSDAPDPGRGWEARTDLAVEAVQAGPAPGVQMEQEHSGGVDITRVRVTDAEGERLVGKPIGQYITFDAPELRRRDTGVGQRVAQLLARQLRRLLHLRRDAEVFVVGLGNWNATPDALGPKVVRDIAVTRHLRAQVPQDLAGGMRSVSALAPGVLGLTGIETGEIIRGIVERTAPDAVIVVDALASRSIARLLQTVQIADTGIHPGSGVGNHRMGINRETLGVPVVAVGVPTVVHAATIAAETIALLAARFTDDERYRGLATFAAEDRRETITAVLAGAAGDLMVTPKEIDVLIDDMAGIIARGINAALHPRMTVAGPLGL